MAIRLRAVLWDRRKNEILGLTWDEIDEASGVIRLSPARSKTLVGRILPISHPIAEALARRRARRNPDSPLVFHRDGITVRLGRARLQKLATILTPGTILRWHPCTVRTLFSICAGLPSTNRVASLHKPSEHRNVVSRSVRAPAPKRSSNSRMTGYCQVEADGRS